MNVWDMVARDMLRNNNLMRTLLYNKCIADLCGPFGRSNINYNSYDNVNLPPAAYSEIKIMRYGNERA